MTKANRELTVDEIRVEENALMDFQFAIIDALHEKNITQAELANMLGVTRARVSQMLSSDANPTIKLVGRALNVLGLRAEYPSASSASALEVLAHEEFTSQEGMEAASCRWRAMQRRHAGKSWHHTSHVGANTNGSDILEAA